MLDKGTSGRVAPAQSAVTPEYKEKWMSCENDGATCGRMVNTKMQKIQIDSGLLVSLEYVEKLASEWR